MVKLHQWQARPIAKGHLEKPPQRKGSRNYPLSECQQRRNHNIAKVRARVEHIFAAIEQMGGKRIRTIGQARANFAMTKMTVTYNIKRLAILEKGPIRAVVCP